MTSFLRICRIRPVFLFRDNQMKRNSFFFLLAFCSTLFLNACTTLDISEQRPTVTTVLSKKDPQWQNHLSQLKQIQRYQNQGQIGYISPEERFSSRFQWQYQNAQNYQLTLLSTLTSTTLTLRMQPQGMTIFDNKGNHRSESDARLLVKEIVGVDVPLEYFADWLKGLPNENADYDVGENHYLARFSYQSEGIQWTADYLNYHQNTQLALPRDILLKNNQNQTLKIRVDNWQL